tara:strand:+ start:3847 stop:4110 length:264 start_codon:yes stop_codon:yes gene_type:complete
MHDFLDNIANHQYQKMHKSPERKKIEITPETYVKMNEEFDREGTPIHIIVPTQEQIDNPTGVKIPETFTSQKPMVVDGSDPWPHSNN